MEHKRGGGEEARKALWRELDPRGLGNEDKDEPCEEVGLWSVRKSVGLERG